MTATDIQPTQLPTTIRAHLAAHAAGQVDAAARTFASTAVVVDEGQTGGVAELSYRFTLADDLVTELVIAL